jgi:hypothetical protein
MDKWKSSYEILILEAFATVWNNLSAFAVHRVIVNWRAILSGDALIFAGPWTTSCKRQNIFKWTTVFWVWDSGLGLRLGSELGSEFGG